MQWRAADTGCRSCHEDGLALEPVGQSEAKGWWPLYFHNVNLADRTLTQLGVEYEDRYVLR